MMPAKKRLVLAVSAALALSAFHAPLSAATVEGGAGMEITYDDTGVESLVQLSADLAALDNVSMAYLPMNVIAVLTAELVAMIPAEAISGLTAEQLAELPAEAIAGLTPEQIKNLTPIALAGMTAEQVGKLSLEAVAALDAEQLGALSEDAIGGFTVEQFNQLTLAALEGLSTENMGGLSGELIEALGLDLLSKLDEDKVKSLSAEDLLWILLNLDATTITPAQVQIFLPTGWSIDLTTGKLKLPRGHKLKLKKHRHKGLVFPGNFTLPYFIDLNISLSLGGTASDGESILDEIKALLEAEGFSNFTADTSETGTLTVTDAESDAEFSFVADMEDVELLEEEEVEPDLSMNEEGNFVVTTSSGIRLVLLTAPKDPVALFNLVPGGEFEMDKKGKVKLKLPSLARTIIGTLNPLIVTAPAGTEPGITFSGTEGEDEVAQIVYEDGTMQLLYPAATDEAESTWSASFYGTGKIKFHSNGHIKYTDNVNVIWDVIPSLNIIENFSAPPLYPYYTWETPEKMVYIDKKGNAQIFYWSADN